MASQEKLEIPSFPSLPMVTFMERPTGVDVITQGYSYRDLDKHGSVSIWNVAAMSQSIRMPNYRLMQRSGERRLLTDKLGKTHMLFAVSTTYEVMPELYKRYHYNNVLRCTDRMAKVGKSSIQHHSECYSNITGALLHRCICHLVFVDKLSKRPSPLPDSFLEDSGSPVPFKRIERLEKPSVTFVTSYKVRWSDIDQYQHTNHANYLRFAYNAVAECCAQGELTRFDKDLGLYHVTKARALNLKETVAGDVLMTHVWEARDDVTAVHTLTVKDGLPVHQCTFNLCRASSVSQL